MPVLQESAACGVSGIGLRLLCLLDRRPVAQARLPFCHRGGRAAQPCHPGLRSAFQESSHSGCGIRTDRGDAGSSHLRGGRDSRGACPKRIFSRLPGFCTFWSLLLACCVVASAGRRLAPWRHLRQPSSPLAFERRLSAAAGAAGVPAAEAGTRANFFFFFGRGRRIGAIGQAHFVSAGAGIHHSRLDFYISLFAQLGQVLPAVRAAYAP